MRFRRKAKLFPGVYLNFSKSGISTTIGVPGASINFGKKGTYLNTGIPGTGFYDRQKLDGNNAKPHYNPQNYPLQINTSVYDSGAIGSKDAESTTSQGLIQLKKTLIDCYQERNDLRNEIIKAKSKLIIVTILWILSCIIIIGFLIKQIKQFQIDAKESLNDLQSQLQKCFINIDFEIDQQFEKSYLELLDKYKTLMTSNRIWDITSSATIDQLTTRSAATTTVKRKPIKFGFGNIDIIKSKYDAMHFENANGGDIYIYPAFIVLVDGKEKYGLIDIQDLDFIFYEQRFLEQEPIPSDTIVVGNTWAKVNKNGTPDKRFKDNYSIPICQYAGMELKSITGLNEAYLFSSFSKSNQFSNKMIEYQKAIRK